MCTIYKKRLQPQLMGDFQTDRVSFPRAFTYRALLKFKNYTGIVCLITKGYVCVFFHKVYLEPTSDLTTEKLLAAIARCEARCGCLPQVHSYNGKTFVRAATLLSKDFLQAIKESVTDAYSHQGLVWRFIIPHMGGLWAAGVKSFKTLFYTSMSARKYTFEELANLLAKIESCLNSRPLSPMTEDPHINWPSQGPRRTIFNQTISGSVDKSSS